MRSINLSNDKRRDTVVGFEAMAQKSTLKYVLNDGTDKINVKVLKSSKATSYRSLLTTFGSESELVEALIKGNPEVDLTYAGMCVSDVKKIYVDNDFNIVFNVKTLELVKNPDGTEKERKDSSTNKSNINAEVPLVWTGKMIPKDKAARMFVFTKKYQLHHVNGLTFDFLYEIAKQLHDQNSMVLLGGGIKGNEPIVFANGGTPYRGFLEGRIDGNRYLLILHITNLELKEFMAKGAE
jgi:hypothetical protein